MVMISTDLLQSPGQVPAPVPHPVHGVSEEQRGGRGGHPLGRAAGVAGPRLRGHAAPHRLLDRQHQPLQVLLQ